MSSKMLFAILLLLGVFLVVLGRKGSGSSKVIQIMLGAIIVLVSLFGLLTAFL